MNKYGLPLFQADGTKLWRRQLSKPVFSSLLVSGNGEIIAVGVDGLINWLSPMDGSLVSDLDWLPRWSVDVFPAHGTMELI